MSRISRITRKKLMSLDGFRKNWIFIIIGIMIHYHNMTSNGYALK